MASRDLSSTTVSLRAVRSGAVDLAVAMKVLSNLDWLGAAVPGDDLETTRRRVQTDLELRVRDGSASSPIRKAALLDIGRPRRSHGAVLIEIGWRSATLAPLFPVFEGRLSVTPGLLTLEGTYLPPFGRLGLVIDRSALHLVAQRTAEALLARFAARLGDGGEPAAGGA